MEFFPFRRDRAQADAVMDRMRDDIAARRIWLDRRRNRRHRRMHRLCRAQRRRHRADRAAGTLEIGWRLAPEYWGKGYVTEAARAWLDFAFETLGRDEIISFAVWNNLRSTAVMERLGMQPRARANSTIRAFPTPIRT